MTRATAHYPPPPTTAVSTGSGLAGAVMLTVLMAVAFAADLSILYTTLLLLGGTALTCIFWDLAVDKVHLRPSTGMDYSAPRSVRAALPIAAVKTVGLGATLAAIAAIYALLSRFVGEDYALAFSLLWLAGPFFLVISPIYILYTTRYMVEPRDKLWHAGALLCGRWHAVDRAAVRDHIRCWTIKGFFLAFLLSILPSLFAGLLSTTPDQLAGNPALTLLVLIQIAFVYDLVFGTIGYALTFRPLDSHIRSANPYPSAWIAAFACYPPIMLMAEGRPLDPSTDGQQWFLWLADMPVLLVVWGGGIFVLACLYSWSTFVFGIRFSNLTHRGIITNGPYALVKHPAYLTKNTFWWMMYLPFLTTTGDAAQAVQNCLMLATVNALYYWRAKTEEKHLMHDPDYRAYAAWIEQYGLFARVGRRLGLRPTPAAPTDHIAAE